MNEPDLIVEAMKIYMSLHKESTWPSWQKDYTTFSSYWDQNVFVVMFGFVDLEKQEGVVFFKVKINDGNNYVVIVDRDVSSFDVSKLENQKNWEPQQNKDGTVTF